MGARGKQILGELCPESYIPFASPYPPQTLISYIPDNVPVKVGTRKNIAVWVYHHKVSGDVTPLDGNHTISQILISER